MSDTARIDDWLNRAFELAFFIHGEREIARQIVVGAMNKLEVASNAQFKRYYYTPNQTRSRVSMSDLQLLQRLVYAESERFEREIEKNANQNRLLIHFIKHLVRVSLKRNSFYATLGVMRILHAYGTHETMEVFNVVVQDPEKVHDDYYFRSRKAQLMKELKARFGELLGVQRGNRGEERFAAREKSSRDAERVREIFAQFTPWATKCVLPERFSPFHDELKPLAFDGKQPDDEHRIELNRIHTVLHQSCLDRLVKVLGFSPLAEKLEIPQFFMEHENKNDSDDWRTKPPALDEAELRSMREILAAQAASRKAAVCGLLRVVVDGAEQARIDLKSESAINFDLDETAELIEVRVVEKAGETILATHLLSFDELKGEKLNQSVTLEGGQRISFQIQPTRDAYGEITGANCGVKFAETAWTRRTAAVWRQFAAPANFKMLAFNPAFVSALLVLAALAGILIYQFRQTPNAPQVVKDTQPSPVPAFTPQQPETSLSPEEKSIEKPDNRKPIRQPEAKPSPEKSPRRIAPKIAPPSQEMAVQPNSKPSNAPEVVRVPIYEKPNRTPDEDSSTVRNGNRRVAVGNALNEIKFLYVEIVGDEDFAGEIKAKLQSERFIITENAEIADAALKITLRRNSDGQTAVANVRIVNANGFVIYPNRKNVTGWKYKGKRATLLPRIARDLVRARDSANQKK